MKTVRKHLDTFQAELTRGLLESHGIQAHLLNKNIIDLIPYASAIDSMRVQVVVADEDYEDAVRIISADGTMDPAGEAVVTQCPFCQSYNIVFGMSGPKRLKKLLGASFLFLSGNPLGKIQCNYYCRDCRQEF